MIKIPENPFILVDGSSYLFRAYHALPPLTTSKGKPTGAIYGVVNMLRKLINDYRPTNMAVVFDSKEKNFRHELYTPYKANRTVMPDELQQQIEPLHSVIKALGLPVIVVPGVEADDVIGTLAKEAKKKKWFTLISTGDKDFAQLVDEHIYLINTMSGTIYNREGVIEKFEIPPELILDYFALIGDTVDNIPGVPKVGPKTALKWLQEYGNLKNIMASAESFTGKVGENLREALEILPLFRELVTIKTNIPLEYKPNELTRSEPNKAQLQTLFTELEFRTWLKELDKPVEEKIIEKTTQQAIEKTTEKTTNPPRPPFSIQTDSKGGKTEYDIILTQSEFEKWLKKLEKAELIAFDTETTSLDYMAAKLVGVSFAVAKHDAAYVPFGHDYPGCPEQLSKDWVIEKLRPLLEDPNKPKVGHHLKYDIEVLLNEGVQLKGIAFDTILESYVLDSAGSRHNMDTLAMRYLQYVTTTYEDIAGKGAKQLSFNQIPIEIAGFYAAEDADITLQLHQTLWAMLQELPKQKSVFENIEMPLIPVLARMEYGGVLIDVKALNEQSKSLGMRLEALEKECHREAGQPFNINSPKQLQEILYGKLNLPVLEKTPTGQASTAEAVLQELAEKYPLPKVILEYRSLSKLKSTYTDALPNQIDEKTGRIHTSYHQAVTATGRLSSTDPNLQNIPIRSAEGRKIRTAFIASPGHKIVAADYSQIELRIMAHMSQDPGLLQAFKTGDDIHRSTAAAVFGVELKEVTSEQRRSAKIINFGLMYGMSAFGLSKQLGLDRAEAETQIARYFSCFPKVKAFIEGICHNAFEQGFVETLFGRRLYLPDLKSPNFAKRRAAERAAINAPMQGTNADLIKLSMIKLDEWIQTNQLDVRMIMQVHDELVFEVSERILEEAIKKIKETMETIFPLSVQLQVDIGIGNNWDEAH